MGEGTDSPLPTANSAGDVVPRHSFSVFRPAHSLQRATTLRREP